MRILSFTQIADSRFCDDIKAEIERIDTALWKAFYPYYYVNLNESAPYLCEFADGTKQLRIDYTLSKNTRKLSWEEAMHKINNVKAVPYRWI